MQRSGMRAGYKRSLLAMLVLPVVLGGCVGGASSSTMATITRADPAEFKPFFFIQAGDPQIGGWTDIPDTQGRFIKLGEISNKLNPAFVIVVGDLVNDGPHQGELAALDEALAKFHAPLKLLCGNHDDLATYRRKYGPDYYAFTHNNCEFICLNSDLIAHQTLSADQRKEADQQWAFFEKALAAAAEQKRAHIFVALHHPPEFLPLWAQRRLNDLFDRYNVQVVLAGHLHRTVELQHGKRTTYAVAGTGWNGDSRGHGYRLFKVFADHVESQYLTIEAPLPDTTLRPTATAPASQSAE